MRREPTNPRLPDSALLLERLLAALLAAIALHGLGILAFSAADALTWCWTGSIVIALAFITTASRFWKVAPAAQRANIRDAWASPWPWLLGALLLTQIVLYPPTMSDSLGYRLPRIFLALQNDSIGRFVTPDYRMNVMTWGWESMALPFASLNKVDWSRLINLIAWLLAYQLVFSWTKPHSTSISGGRLVALALTTAPVFMLQATSTANDLYAGVWIMVGAWMIRRFDQAPGPVPVMASLLALLLAANTKPQFLVLGLPWLLWWFFAPGKPCRQVPLWLLLVAAPLYTLASPLPLLALNYWIDGGLLGEPTGDKAAPWLMAIAGLIQFSASQFQLPVFPGAEVFGQTLQSLPGYHFIQQEVPKFSPGVGLMTQIDSASFGLIHSVLITAGCIISWRSGSKNVKYWLLTTVFALTISASQVVPSTSGRAFMGFGILLYPTAATGLARIQHACHACHGIRFAAVSGLLAMILNPSAPLWPSAWLGETAHQLGMHGIASKISHYRSYQERAFTGLGILDPVPTSTGVGVLARGFTPLSPLWSPSWQAHRIEFLHETPAADFAISPHDWLLMAENAEEQFPELYRDYQRLACSWETVKSITYLPNIQQGPETWTLYRRPHH